MYHQAKNRNVGSYVSASLELKGEAIPNRTSASFGRGASDNGNDNGQRAEFHHPNTPSLRSSGSMVVGVKMHL